MCTLSWKPLDDGYVLFFNRDEQCSRPIALPPRAFEANGVRYLAPTDTARGGTWLLVNEHGLSLVLLNHASAMRLAPTHPASRGWLPHHAADCLDVETAIKRIAARRLDDVPPFHLIAADASQASLLTWDGFDCTTTQLAADGYLLTTSSYRPEIIASTRLATFARDVGDMASASVEQLAAFHEYRGEDAAAGIRMSRPDACTHSIARIDISLGLRSIHFSYQPQAEISPAMQSTAQHLHLVSRPTKSSPIHA